MLFFFALIAYHNQAFIYKLALREKVDNRWESRWGGRENLQGTDQLPLNLFYIKLKLCSVCLKKSEKTDNYAQSCNCRNILFNYKVCQYRSNNVFCLPSISKSNWIGKQNAITPFIILPCLREDLSITQMTKKVNRWGH